MADQTTLMGLLKTPSQIRKESQDRMMEESLARSQMMLRGSTGGTTALPGIISSYGAQAAQRGTQAGAGLLRGVAGGIGQAVGGDVGQSISNLGVPMEERQARETQGALTGVKFNDPKSIQAAADKIRNVNPQAAAMLDAKAVEAQQVIDEATRKQEELNIRRGTLEVKQRQAQLSEERLEFDKGKVNLDQVLGIDVGQFSEESQKQAVKLYQSGKNEGETQADFVQRITDTLELPTAEEFKDTNVLMPDGSIQRGTLEDGKLKITDTQGNLVDAPPQALLISDTVDPRNKVTESGLKAAMFVVKNSDEYKQFEGFFSGDEQKQTILVESYARKRADSRLGNVSTPNLIRESYLENFNPSMLKEKVAGDGRVYLVDVSVDPPRTLREKK